jgi:hypothetical protein
MRVLSLGWGKQSFGLAVMAALGEIEPVDFVVHSDTTHERTATYEFARKWTPWLEERGLRVITTSDNKAASKIRTVNEHGTVFCPVFTSNGSNIRGQLNRSCTQRWKIAPMRRVISAELDKRGLKKKPGAVTQLIGISLDEFQRMRVSDTKYLVNEYPLVDMRMSRHDCEQYLRRHNIEIPPRSVCVFCPYQRPREWRWLKENYPQDWNKAVEIDTLLRKARPPYDLYICDQRKPLPECDFSTPEDEGQLRLFEICEEGYCFV